MKISHLGSSSVESFLASGRPFGVTFSPVAAAIQAAGVSLGKPPLLAEDLRRTTDELHRLINVIAPELQFSVDSSSGRTVMRITDGAANEILFQFPSETALRVSQGIDSFQTGLLVDRRV